MQLRFPRMSSEGSIWTSTDPCSWPEWKQAHHGFLEVRQFGGWTIPIWKSSEHFKAQRSLRDSELSFPSLKTLMTSSPVKLVQSIIYPWTSTFLSHLISSHSCTYQICFPSTSVLFLPASIWKLAGIQLDSDQFVAPNVDDLFTSAAMETSKSYPLPILPVHFLRLEEVPMYPGKEDGGHTMSGGTSHVFDRYCTHGILGGVLLYDFCVDWNRSIKSEETLGVASLAPSYVGTLDTQKAPYLHFQAPGHLFWMFCLDVLILDFNRTKTPVRVKNPGWKKDHFSGVCCLGFKLWPL